MNIFKKYISIIFIFCAFTTFAYHTEECVQRIKENYVEHSNPAIAMIMDGQGHGTGFYISSNIIVTNAHVVGRKNDVKVQLHDNTIVEGIVICTDSLHDLAFILTDCSDSYLPLNVDNLQRGEELYTIGFGGDTWYSIRYGEMLNYYYVKIDWEGLDTMYAIADLAVIPGHSGSPVFNENGYVVGIVSRGNGEVALFVPSKYIFELYNLYLKMVKEVMKNG